MLRRGGHPLPTCFDASRGTGDPREDCSPVSVAGFCAQIMPQWQDASKRLGSPRAFQAPLLSPRTRHRRTPSGPEGWGPGGRRFTPPLPADHRRKSPAKRGISSELRNSAQVPLSHPREVSGRAGRPSSFLSGFRASDCSWRALNVPGAGPVSEGGPGGVPMGSRPGLTGSQRRWRRQLS